MPRKLSWVRGKGYQQNNDGRKAEVFCDVVRSHALLPDTLGVFVFIARFLPIIRLTTSTWEGLWSAGASPASDQAVLHDEQAGTQADTFVCCIAQYD